MTNDLFNSDDQSEQDVDYLAWAKEKYGEDPTAWAKAKYHADKHVSSLEKENQGMREDLNKRITMEEMMASIKASQASPNASHEDVQREAPATKPGVEMDEIEKLLDARLSKEKQKELAQRNVAFVDQELRKAWGPSYQDRLKKEVRSLGMDESFAANITETNPQLFLKAVVGSSSPNRAPDVTPPKSSIGTSLSQLSNSNIRDNRYYEKIRKSDPGLYWDRATQSQMKRDANDLGIEVFYKE